MQREAEKEEADAEKNRQRKQMERLVQEGVAPASWQLAARPALTACSIAVVLNARTAATVALSPYREQMPGKPRIVNAHCTHTVGSGHSVHWRQAALMES